MEKKKKQETKKVSYEKPRVEVFKFETNSTMVLSKNVNEGSIYEL